MYLPITTDIDYSFGLPKEKYHRAARFVDLSFAETFLHMLFDSCSWSILWKFVVENDPIVVKTLQLQEFHRASSKRTHKLHIPWLLFFWGFFFISY